MKNAMLPALFSLFLAFVPTLSAAEPSWPVFHGPKGDNKSTDTGLLKSWPDGGPKLLWKIDTLGNTEFPGYSGVTVADEKLFTTGNVKNGDDEKEANSFVFALDTATGTEIWRYDNGPGWTGHYPGDRSTPTVDGDRVYAFSSLGRMACLELATGKEIWARNIRDEFSAKLPTWSYAESPVIDGDVLLCWPGSQEAAALALDKMTGKTIWATPGTEQLAAYATTIVFEQDGLKIYANMNQKGLIGVNAKTGEQLFFVDHPTSYDVNATMPVYQNGRILTSAGYGTTGTQQFKLTVSGDKVSVEKVWHEKKLDNQHGGLVVLDGYIYGSAHKYKGGNWLCLKWEDGSIAWDEQGVRQGSVTFADGMLYCMSEKDGTVALVKATPEKYEEISRFMLPEEGAGLYWAHPVVCGKKLYLRHAQFLYCYDVAE